MSAFFCVVLSCVGRGLAMGRSPTQGVLSKYLKGFRVPELICASEQAWGLNLWNVLLQGSNNISLYVE